MILSSKWIATIASKMHMFDTQESYYYKRIKMQGITVTLLYYNNYSHGKYFFGNHSRI